MIFQSSEEIVDARVIISDFGEAFFQDEERKELHTPILLLPPEIFFREHLGPAIDVWTLGCSLYEILGERPLFEGFMPDQDHVIAEMVSTLGHLPKRWWDRWQQRTDFFLEDGSWKTDTHRSHAPYSRSLAERLRIMGRGEDPATCEFSPEEMACLEKLLKAMLTYEPSERITASAAVASEWMERWGRRAIDLTCTSLES
jgi:serine/threonine-protein kinase SRPK3